MSNPSNFQNINLEFLRKQAKALLKRCRAGDDQGLARVRQQLSKPIDAANIRLADVQHALAREHGYANWAALKHHDDPIERFLVAIRGRALKQAQHELTELPEIAEESIHAACAVGDHDAVAHHLSLDATLATADHNGWPPLLYACASPFSRANARRQNAGILQCVNLLLDAGADPNTFVLTDPTDPETKLAAAHRAFVNGNLPLVSLLVQRGATADWNDRAGGKLQREQPELYDAFRQISKMPETRQRTKQYLEEIRKQPQGPSGPDVWSVARQQSESRSADVYRPLINRIDPNRTGVDGLTTFHRTILIGTAEAVELFLQHGADLNRLTPEGRTPLVLAVRAGKPSIAAVLRAHGASDEGLRPIDELVGAWLRMDVAEADRILKSQPAAVKEMAAEDFELLIEAAALNRVPQARLMLECGCDPGGLGESSITALHAAAWHGHIEMVGLLLEFHAPVNVREKTYGSSPLGWAAHGSKYCRNDDDTYCAVVNTLISAGAGYEAAITRAGVRPESTAAAKVAELLQYTARGE